MSINIAARDTDCMAAVTVSSQAFVEDRTIKGIKDARIMFDRPGQIERLKNGMAVKRLVPKGRNFFIGPAIQYNYKNMFFNAKVQFDTNVENRPKGKKFWFKFMYAF
nr:transporter [uncultured Desulfobacter sp.]